MRTNNRRKVGFLVLDFTWKIFSQTGNIEAYLLLKELERQIEEDHSDQLESVPTQIEM